MIFLWLEKNGGKIFGDYFAVEIFFVQIFSSKFLVVIIIFFDFFELKKWREQNG